MATYLSRILHGINLLLLINTVNCTNGEKGFDDRLAEIFTMQSPNCLSPHKEHGTCISIYDCENLKYIVEHQLTTYYQFLRNSQCNGGVGQSPFVCCVKDAQYFEKTGRIIFPDEFNRTITDNKSITTTTELPKSNEEFKDNTVKVSKFLKFPNCGKITISNKIYGGSNAEETEFSWMVILEFRNLTTGKLIMDCSGSLINARYVLTAAHCVKGEILRVNGKLDYVRVGDHNTDLGAFQRIEVDSIIPHEDFKIKGVNGTRNEHDIALIRLARAVSFNDSLQPACLPLLNPTKELTIPTTFVAAGWGHNSFKARTAIKQKVSLPLVDHEVCRNSYRKRFYLADDQICAGGEFRKDSCNGDSGGPLMHIEKDHWVLEGLVSFGLKCGLEEPGIYTNVRHYLDWISEHMET